MKAIESEDIVREFGGCIAEGKGIVNPISKLKQSKGNIRTAYETYIKALIEVDKLTEEHEMNLVNTYGLLEGFINDEEANLLNDPSKKEDPETVKKILEIFNKQGEASDHFQDFVNHCKENKGQYPEFVDEVLSENEFIKKMKTKYGIPDEDNKSLMQLMSENKVMTAFFAVMIIGWLWNNLR